MFIGLRIAEKYYSRGVVGPSNCLVMFYLVEEQFDKARELYQRYNLANSSRIMFQSALSSARIRENPKIVEELMSLLNNAPSITQEVWGLLHSNLVNIYGMYSCKIKVLKMLCLVNFLTQANTLLLCKKINNFILFRDFVVICSN